VAAKPEAAVSISAMHKSCPARETRRKEYFFVVIKAVPNTDMAPSNPDGTAAFIKQYKGDYHGKPDAERSRTRSRCSRWRRPGLDNYFL
jgi:hypothetical protein